MAAPEIFDRMLTDLNRIFAEMPPVPRTAGEYLAAMLRDETVAPADKEPWKASHGK